MLIKQVVLNLLSNAVKFTPEGGHVGLTAKRVDGAITSRHRRTGIGIWPTTPLLGRPSSSREPVHQVTRRGLGLARDSLAGLKPVAAA